MRIRGIRTGARVQDKITKTVYNVVMENGTVNLVDEDGKTVGVVTEETAETYRYLGNDTPAPKPDASVTDDGELIVDGETVVTGQLKPVAVFPVRGKVLVMVKPLDENVSDGTVDIFEYEPIFDRFTKLLSGIMNPFIKEIADGLYVIAHNNTYEYTIKATSKDEQDEVITAIDKAAVLLYDGTTIKSLYTGIKPVPTTDADIQVEESADKIVVMLVSTQGTVSLDCDCDNYNDCDCDGDCDDCEDCDDYGSVAKLVDLDNKTRVIVLSTLKNEDGIINPYWTSNEWLVNGSVKSVTDAMDGSYLIVTDKEVTFTNNGHRKRVASGAAAVKAGETHPYLVGAIIKTGNTFTLKLADENRNIVKVVSTDTKDRGTLITVE